MPKYGISLLPDASSEHQSGQSYYQNMIRVAEIAEEVGLDYVKMTEHYMNAYGGYCPDPLAFLSAVAARTSRVRLMTGGIQASFHHPVQLAARTAQLDALSGGRLDVGFARAFLPYEFDTFGVDMDSSTDRFRQTVTTVVRLWNEAKVSADTPYFSFHDVTSFPTPTQSPHPPVWAAALLTRSSFEWIGDSGFNLLIASSPKREKIEQARELIDLYRERFRAAPGNAGREPTVAINFPLFLAESDADARSAGKQYLLRHWDTFNEAAATAWADRSSSAYAGYREAVTKRYGKDMNTEELESTVFGDAASAADKLREISETLTPDVILFQLDYGQQPLTTMERTLRILGRDVLPRL